MDKLVNDIEDLIQGFKPNTERHLPILEAAVNRLIAERSQDKKSIKHLLDTILSLTMMGIGEKLFIRLVNYYKTVDPEDAAFYWNEFDAQN